MDKHKTQQCQGCGAAEEEKKMDTGDKKAAEYVELIHRIVEMEPEEFEALEREVEQLNDRGLHAFVKKIKIERGG